MSKTNWLMVLCILVSGISWIIASHRITEILAFSEDNFFNGRVWTLITSLFLHDNLTHLIGNIIFLYIFGDNVEDTLGHGRFLIFYLLCGLAGSAVHITLGINSTIPMVGASGAISGVMGAYILLFPSARVLTLVIFFFITIIEIPAYWFLAIWFIFQFLGGMRTIGAGGGGVAFWAHVGGFLAGMWLIRMWTRHWREQQQGYWQ